MLDLTIENLDRWEFLSKVEFKSKWTLITLLSSKFWFAGGVIIFVVMPFKFNLSMPLSRLSSFLLLLALIVESHNDTKTL